MSEERREWMDLVAELREQLAAAQTRSECPGCGLTPGPTAQRWCAECVGELQQRLAAAEAELDRVHEVRDNNDHEFIKELYEHAWTITKLMECRRLLREFSEHWRMSGVRGNHRSCACSTCTKLDQLADEAAKAGGLEP